MGCDESKSSPNIMAKLGEGNRKYSEYQLTKIETKLEKALNRAKSVCLEQCQSKHFQYDLTLIADLTSTFMEFFDDDVVNNWGLDMHNRVKATCEKILELCVFVMDEDSIDVLDALAILFDPKMRFHTFNATKMSESVPPGRDIPDEEVYARPLAHPSNPRGWFVDLINRFGDLGGFHILLSRFQPCRRRLTFSMIRALLQPFGLCHELLTANTIVKYFMPIVKRFQVILDAFTMKDLGSETQIPSIHLDISATIQTITNLMSRVPEQKEIIRNLESLRMRTIFRLLLHVKNIEESIRRLNYCDFSVQQWNDLLEYFQTSWKTANDETRGKMLEVIQTWVDGYLDETVGSVLALLWDLTHSDEVSTEIMEKTITAHAVALPFFNPYEGGYYVFEWLDKCVEEIKSNDKWALRALKHITEICDVFEYSTHGVTDFLLVKTEDVKEHLHDNHNLITLVIDNLLKYMDKVRELVKENPEIDENTFKPDGRYIHRMQVQIRLDVLTCLVRDGTLSFESEQLKQIWQCLVMQPIFTFDKNDGFSWFGELTELDNNLKPALMRDFLKQNVLQFDPTLFTGDEFSGLYYFFIQANKDDDGKFTVDNLIGIDYLWQVVTSCPEDIAREGFQLLKEINRDVGSQLKRSDSDTHKTLIAEFRNQMQDHSDTLSCLMGVRTIEGNDQRKNEIVMETQKMIRLMGFMEEYIKECGWEGNKEPKE